MNKQELQKKYQEIVLKTNGGNDDYVVALCQIANAINELDEPKQDTKWKKLERWLTDKHNNDNDNSLLYTEILIKMRELEGEDE